MHKTQKIIMILTIALIVLILSTSVFAIFMEDGGAPYDFTSLRGEEIEIYGGNGMYAYNTTEYALMMRAYDWCYLVLAIPIMLIGLILYRKKSIIGCFILLSSFFFFFYSFFINSIAVAYNNYFLIYIAVFVASIFAMILMINDISFEHIRNKIMPRLPIKTMTVITLILVSYFFISWMIIDFSSLFQGVVHPDVSIYTTAGFNIVDLSIFVTLSITGIILLFKRKPLGTILVLMLILMAPLTLIALSIYLVMNVHFQQLSILSIEFPLMIFAVVVLGIDIFTISKIKGIKL